MDNKNLKQMDQKEEVKKEIKKLSLDEFINKALERKLGRKNEIDIPIPGYGPVTFKRPTNDQSLEYLNASVKALKVDKEGNVLDTDYIILNEAAKQYIYFACPYAQNSDLQQALEIKDPFDTPIELFGVDNLVEIASKIQEAFGDGTRVKKEIKNS